MYIFETIFATILLQTYLDRIKWSDNHRQDLQMVKGKNVNKQSSSDATSEGSHPSVQRQLPRTAKQKHAAAEQERLRNVEKSTAALAKEAIRVGNTPTHLQDEAARGEITMREANIMRIAERDRIAKL